jgi:hypothetical protein
MKATDVKIGQRVKFTQNEMRSSWDNYYGTSTWESSVERVGNVIEIFSKTCVIVEDKSGNKYSVEPRKMKLV